MRLITIFLLVLLVIVGCKERYVETKFTINNFSCAIIDSPQNGIAVKFDVMYYSDSTVANYFASGMEKGLHGSDDTIVYFGLVDSKYLQKNSSIVTSCENLSFDSFVIGFNRKNRYFVGQSFDFEYKFCVPPSPIKKRTILLVLSNKNRVDSLLVTCK